MSSIAKNVDWWGRGRDRGSRGKGGGGRHCVNQKGSETRISPPRNIQLKNSVLDNLEKI